MWNCCATLFKRIKDDPVAAANVGGFLSSTAASIVLYALHSEDIVFDDMNEFAAQAIIGAIGFGAFVVGAVTSALTQKVYSRYSSNQDSDNTEGPHSEDILAMRSTESPFAEDVLSIHCSRMLYGRRTG